MQIALEQLEALLKTLDDKKVAEFEYEDERIRLRIAYGRAQVQAVAPLTTAPLVAAGPVVETVDPSIAYITSPFVGTFYRAASPEAENFVEVGGSIKSGQTLCIIEAMKLMNEIEAEFTCSIVEVLTENGKSVEFGQKLFKVRKV